jgi:hypothetical protein
MQCCEKIRRKRNGGLNPGCHFWKVRSVDPGSSVVLSAGLIEKILARPAVVVGNFASTQCGAELLETLYLSLPTE